MSKHESCTIPYAKQCNCQQRAATVVYFNDNLLILLVVFTQLRNTFFIIVKPLKQTLQQVQLNKIINNNCNYVTICLQSVNT